ncbi:MAG: hypothetical protein M9894_29210 [Planctomycetes bacterium]|nr:hypothetical protein [Planctomycetota bacterium]
MSGRALLAALPPAARERIEAVLEEDEEVVWAAAPVRWHLPQVGAAVLPAAFGLAFVIVFAAVGRVVALSSGWLSLDTALSTVCAVPGLFLLLIPYLCYRGAAGTGYALTNRRVIIHNVAGGLLDFRCYGPEAVPGMEVIEFMDGAGNIVLEVQRGWGRNADRSPELHESRHGLLGVRRVREVEALVRATLGGGDDQARSRAM